MTRSVGSTVFRHSSARRTLRAVLVLLGAAALAADSPLAAQAPAAAPANGADSVWVTPRGRYDANFLHRFLLSSGHRKLWATEIKVEVLDLDHFAGGLTVTRPGGGMQTASLRFRGGDGRIYVFRSIDKDVSRSVDPELRGVLTTRVLQDQIGSLLPVSTLVVAPLLEAAGVLHAEARLVVMPDDARLGQYQPTFGGLLGFIEERPNEAEDGEPGFAGAVRVTGSAAFLNRLEQSSRNRLDDVAYLRARLIDAFVGDWDRHPGQWRWAAFEEQGLIVWRPIPRDRDWALAKMDGLLVQLIPMGFPQYVGFGYNYPSAFRLTWAARALDRTLLSGTPRETWTSVASELQRRLTDVVIDDAVRRLPLPYYERIGEKMTAALRHRRDELAKFADEFYRVLAGDVEIHATDERDMAEIVRLEGDRLRVEITSGDSRANAPGEPYFQRVFSSDETDEIRLYLHGGDDHAAVIGQTNEGPTVRIIGGGGNDVLIDRTSGAKVHFYDDRGHNRFERARKTGLDQRSWVQPFDSSSETQQARARDWGSLWAPVPVITYDPDLGLFLGAGAVHYGYGFRHFPYADKFAFTVGYGTSSGRVRADVSYDFPLMGRTWRGLLHARYSGAEVDRFYDFGNESASGRERSFYLAQRAETTLEAHLGARLGRLLISAGPGFNAVRPFDNDGTLIDSVAPYGYGNFDQIGATARLFWDSRNQRRDPTRGGYVLLRSGVYPGSLDVEETYGTVSGEAAAFLTAAIPTHPTLALHAGGEKLFGEYPYFQAAYLGGRGTLRGFPTRRFAGDASVYTNAELRLRLFRHGLVFPGHFGLLGLADAGRVFLDGEDSNRWHATQGAGVWLSFFSLGNTLTVAAARSSERTGLYVGGGFAF